MRELLKLKEENLLFFDIETAPLVKELEPDTPLYDSWEYKVNKDGIKEQSDIIKSYSEQAGLYPEFAKVISVVIGKIMEGNIVLLTYDFEDEKELLTNLNNKIDELSGDTLIGFANIGFDAPFLFKRMLINGIKPSDKLDSSGLKPWEVQDVDLAKTWQGTSYNRASLINISVAFGLPSPKDDIAGYDVGRVYWENPKNNLERISKYCAKDVESTVNIFRKMCLREPLSVSMNVVVKSSGKQNVIEDTPIIRHLFNGGEYDKKHEKLLSDFIKSLDEDSKNKVFVILDSLVSTASGKKTKITKDDIKRLKSE